MAKVKVALAILFGLCLGIGSGFLLFLSLSSASLFSTNSLLAPFGMYKPQVVGFLPHYLLEKSKENYNPYLTTLNYFALMIGTDGQLVTQINPSEEEPALAALKTNAVQKRLQIARQKNLILSLAVEQQNEASISALLSNPQKHAKNLLTDIIPLMKKYGFTDLNVDIESSELSDAKKKQQFLIFVQTITDELHKQHIGTVTVDIAPIDFVKNHLINPVKIGAIVDYVIIMGYDYHSMFSSTTGAIAPIGGQGKEIEYDVATTLAIAKKEIPPEKIIFGLPLYGYEWSTLQNFKGSATIPNTWVTSSNRHMSKFIISCTLCTVREDALAQEPQYVFQDNKDDPYFHQAFVFDTKAFNQRLLLARDDKFAGVALWALGYEGDTMLQPLTTYKETSVIQ